MLPELQTFLLGAAPISELRGAIPFAILMHNMNPLSAYFFSVLGNAVPVFLLLYFLNPVSLWLSKNFAFMKKFFDYLFEKTKKEHSKKIKERGYFALFIFTAIPLPLTGAWTASLVALLFGFSFLKSAIAIIGGVMLAGIIVLFIVEGGVAIEQFYGAQALGGVLLLALFLYFIYYQKNKQKNV
jgi:uncharacterized membrane protein